MVTVGMESEYLLIDKMGNITNQDSLVLSHKKNNDKIIDEGSHAMIEVITDPALSISELAKDYIDSLSRLESICKDYSLSLIPSSTVNTSVSPHSKDYQKSRGMHKRFLLGSETREIEHQFPGTHVHVVRNEDNKKEFNQYLLMQAADTLFAAVSSTPYFDGISNMKDSRVELYRNKMFKDYPIHGQLLPYVDSISDLFNRQGQAAVDWISELYLSFMEPQADDFNEYNSVWGPFRYTKHGTFESRSADSTTPQLALGLAAAFYGMSTVIDGEDYTISIDTEGKESAKDYFIPQNGVITIPSSERLKQYEQLGVYEGLSNNDIHTYITNILKFSSNGLSHEDKEYLSPLVNEVIGRKSFSDRMREYVSLQSKTGNSNVISDDVASLLRLYTAHEYSNNLSLLNNKMSSSYEQSDHNSKSIIRKVPLVASVANF